MKTWKEAMLNSAEIRWRIAALSLLATLGPIARSSLAQSEVPSAQQATCNKYQLGSECYALYQEFSFKTLAQTGSTSLDTQYMDLVPFLAENVKQAYVGYLSSAAYSQAESIAKAAALQLISTELRVNQTGNTSSSSGSTNLASKATTTDFLSIAAESGAFTDTTNGNSVSLQANADGLLKYFANKPVFSLWESKYAHLLQPWNFSVTINVDQGSTSTVPATGSGTASTPSVSQILLPSNNASFSAFTTTYQIYKKYNPQDTSFQKKWRTALAAHQQDLQNASKQVFAAANGWLAPLQSKPLPPDVQALQTQWHALGTEAENDGDFEALVAAFSPYWRAVSKYAISTAEEAKDLLALNSAVMVYRSTAEEVITEARGAPLASASYTYSAPAGQPATHAGKINFGATFAGGKIDPKTGKRDGTRTFWTGAELTANLAFEVYADRPSGATYGRFRDVQAAGELDKPLGGTANSPRATLSIAGYGQYQSDPTALSITAGNLAPGTNITLPANAQVLLGTAGWLAVAQGKVVVNITKGLSLPLAIKWSNKTTLLDASDVRGQFGLSYDLSSLSKLLGGT